MKTRNKKTRNKKIRNKKTRKQLLYYGGTLDNYLIVDSPRKMIFTEKISGNIAGEIEYSYKDRDSLDIKLIFINEEYRNKGLSTLFLKYFIQNKFDTYPSLTDITLENRIGSDQFPISDESVKNTIRKIYSNLGFTYKHEGDPYLGNDMILHKDAFIN